MWAQERAWLVKPRQEKIGQIWNVGTSQRPSMLHNVRNAGHGPVWMMVIMTDDDMQSEEDGIGHHGHWGPLALFWTRMLAFGRYHDDNCFETALTKVLRMAAWEAVLDNAWNAAHSWQASHNCDKASYEPWMVLLKMATIIIATGSSRLTKQCDIITEACAVHIVWMVGVIFARGKLHRRGKDSLLLKLQELFRRKHLPDISLPESWLLLIDLRTIFWICRPKINIFWPGKRDGSSMSLWGHCPPAYHQMYPMSPSLHCRLIIWRVPHTCPLQFHPLRRHFTSSGFSSQLMSFRPIFNFNVHSVRGERMQKSH